MGDYSTRPAVYRMRHSLHSKLIYCWTTFFWAKPVKFWKPKHVDYFFFSPKERKGRTKKKKSTASGDLEANRTAVHRRRHRLLSTALFGAHKQQSESKPPLNINLNCNPSVCRYTTTTKHREPSSSTAYES